MKYEKKLWDVLFSALHNIGLAALNILNSSNVLNKDGTPFDEYAISMSSEQYSLPESVTQYTYKSLLPCLLFIEAVIWLFIFYQKKCADGSIIAEEGRHWRCHDDERSHD